MTLLKALIKAEEKYGRFDIWRWEHGVEIQLDEDFARNTKKRCRGIAKLLMPYREKMLPMLSPLLGVTVEAP